jgi:hypothetical protein
MAAPAKAGPGQLLPSGPGLNSSSWAGVPLPDGPWRFFPSRPLRSPAGPACRLGFGRLAPGWAGTSSPGWAGAPSPGWAGTWSPGWAASSAPATGQLLPHPGWAGSGGSGLVGIPSKPLCQFRLGQFRLFWLGQAGTPLAQAGLSPW